MNLNERITLFVEDYFSRREGTEALQMIKEVDLVDEGFMDSLDILSLASQLEKEFGTKLDFSDPKTFVAMRRFNSIINLILE
jgi:acyl carrier protein